MKQKGGLPPVFRKEKPNVDLIIANLEKIRKEDESRRQTPKSGLSQMLGSRPRSPFTGPGPSTAGRKLYRRRTRKIRRRS